MNLYFNHHLQYQEIRLGMVLDSSTIFGGNGGGPLAKPTERREGWKGKRDERSSGTQGIEHLIQVIITNVQNINLVILCFNNFMDKWKPPFLLRDDWVVFHLISIIGHKFAYIRFVS